MTRERGEGGGWPEFSAFSDRKAVLAGYSPANPRKLTALVAKRLIEAFRLGASNKDACRYAGISVDTLALWLAAGEDELRRVAERGDDPLELANANLLAPLAVLAFLIEGAKGERAMESIAAIRAAAPSDWRAAAWHLERSQPDDWGKRERVDRTHVLFVEVERIAQERGLSAEATDRLKDFVREREKRRAS